MEVYDKYDSVKMLNIEIQSLELEELLKDLKKGVVFTPNVDHIMKLQKDKEFFEVYKHADWVICDSNILNIGAKILGKAFKEVIPGSSLLPAYYNYHRENKKIKIFLLGAAEGVAKKAMENINSKVGWDMVVGSKSPSFGFENNPDECDELVGVVNNSGANVLVVGVGAPKQEKWIVKYKNKFSNIDVFMALGATIDFEAGNVRRAPVLFQKLYLEWLYRLLCEPKRLAKRYLVDDLPFFKYLFLQKVGKYKSPF